MAYASPSFIAVPMATICSKTGCPQAPVTLKAPTSQVALAGGGGGISYVTFKQDIRARADGDFLYVFEPAAQLVFEINEIGGEIIKLLIADGNVATTVGAIANKYGVKPADVAEHIAGFLVSLEQTGLSIKLQ